MHSLPDVVGQPVRALKGGRVGIKQLLEYPAGHERSVPLSRCVMRPCAFPSGPSLPCPPASSPDLTPSSIAAEALSSNNQAHLRGGPQEAWTWEKRHVPPRQVQRLVRRPPGLVPELPAAEHRRQVA